MDKATLLYYMPDYYKNSKVIDTINNANALELTKINEKIESALNQFFLTTADNSISRWENEFGIKADATKSLSERRNRILGKLRGLGTSTVQTIKNIALSYVNEVNVVENNSDYSFMLDLINNQGFPYILEDLYETIEEIKPAHLQANYKMTSNTKDTYNIRAFTLCGEEIKVFPYQITTVESSGKVKLALGQTQGAETISVNPKEVI